MIWKERRGGGSEGQGQGVDCGDLIVENKGERGSNFGGGAKAATRGGGKGG